MDTMHVHADRTLPAWVQGAELPWLPSPEPGVERRVLERIGGEVALATTLVRYRPGSRFPRHAHALGEEFLVLEGTFSDEHGDYPAGTYVRNPPGTVHAPGSDEGCVVFVKLRQMATPDRRAVCLRPEHHAWHDTVTRGLSRALLDHGDGVSVSLERLQPGAIRPEQDGEGGEEWLVLEGSVRQLHGTEPPLLAWGWVRDPAHHRPAVLSDNGALLWVKRGHLPSTALSGTRLQE